MSALPAAIPWSAPTCATSAVLSWQRRSSRSPALRQRTQNLLRPLRRLGNPSPQPANRTPPSSRRPPKAVRARPPLSGTSDGSSVARIASIRSVPREPTSSATGPATSVMYDQYSSTPSKRMAPVISSMTTSEKPAPEARSWLRSGVESERDRRERRGPRAAQRRSAAAPPRSGRSMGCDRVAPTSRS